MAIAFGSANGTAVKSEVDYMKLVNGDNVFRIVSGLLPRYVYWIKSEGMNKEIPFECIQFNRQTEKFMPSVADPIRDMFPDLRCKWAYACQVINRATNKVEVLALKKDMLDQIMSMCGQLGVDPTSPENGIEFIVERKKTGSNKFDVSYTVKQLLSKSKPLSEADRALVAAAKSIDEIFPIPTYDEQKAAVLEWTSKQPSAKEDTAQPTASAAKATNEAISELDND